MDNWEQVFDMFWGSAAIFDNVCDRHDCILAACMLDRGCSRLELLALDTLVATCLANQAAKRCCRLSQVGCNHNPLQLLEMATAPLQRQHVL